MTDATQPVLAGLFRAERDAKRTLREALQPLAVSELGLDPDDPWTSWDAAPVWDGDLLLGIKFCLIHLDDRNPPTRGRTVVHEFRFGF
jgi:hypothetical protein